MDETLRGETSTEQFQAMCWLLFLYQTVMHIDVLNSPGRKLKQYYQIVDKKKCQKNV